MDKVFTLAEAYIKEYRKYAPYPLFKITKVKETKWWKIFQGIIYKFGEDEDWNPYEYVKFAFEEKGKILPFELSNKNLYQDYKDYKETRTKDNTSIALEIKATLEEIQRWCKKNKKEGLDIRSFFSDSKNKMYLMRGRYSKYFLSICKCFYDLTEKERNNIMNENELIAKRRAILDDESLYRKMKGILKDEFMDN